MNLIWWRQSGVRLVTLACKCLDFNPFRMFVKLWLSHFYLNCFFSGDCFVVGALKLWICWQFCFYSHLNLFIFPWYLCQISHSSHVRYSFDKHANNTEKKNNRNRLRAKKMSFHFSLTFISTSFLLSNCDKQKERKRNRQNDRVLSFRIVVIFNDVVRLGFCLAFGLFLCRSRHQKCCAHAECQKKMPKSTKKKIMKWTSDKWEEEKTNDKKMCRTKQKSRQFFFASRILHRLIRTKDNLFCYCY